jgi:FkbM family methyltransferase
MGWKEPVKKWLRWLPFDLTRNMRYDRLTRRIIARHLHPASNAIDIGCHKGEILDQILSHAPRGTHYGFEPLPAMCLALKKKYARLPHCRIHEVALSDRAGEATFNYVISNPSYSGLQKRAYDRPHEEDTTITVQTGRLDDLLPHDHRVDLIKLDVEGAELLVLSGALETLRRWAPLVIFEYGLGASDVYGATPDKLHRLFAGCGMAIWLPEAYLAGSEPLDLPGLQQQYYGRKNYYFVAAPLSP